MHISQNILFVSKTAASLRIERFSGEKILIIKHSFRPQIMIRLHDFWDF